MQRSAIQLPDNVSKNSSRQRRKIYSAWMRNKFVAVVFSQKGSQQLRGCRADRWRLTFFRSARRRDASEAGSK